MNYGKTKPLRFIAATACLGLSCAGMLTRSDRTQAQLESEIAVLKKKATVIEKKNAMLESENSDFKKEIHRLSNDYSVLKKQSDARIKDLETLNQRMKDEFSLTIERITEDAKQKELSLNARLEEMKSECISKEKSLNEKILILEKTLTERNEALAADEKTIANMKEDAQRSRTEIEALQKRINEMSDETQRLKNERDALQGTVKENDKTIEAQAASIKHLNALIKEKDASLKDLEAKIESLTSDRARPQ